MCKYISILNTSQKFLTNPRNKVFIKTDYNSWEGSFVKRMILNGKDNRNDIFLL